MIQQNTMVKLACGLRFRANLRAVARALIWGGGGCLFIYWRYTRLISFEINPNNN